MNGSPPIDEGLYLGDFEPKADGDAARHVYQVQRQPEGGRTEQHQGVADDAEPLHQHGHAGYYDDDLAKHLHRGRPFQVLQAVEDGVAQAHERIHHDRRRRYPHHAPGDLRVGNELRDDDNRRQHYQGHDGPQGDCGPQIGGDYGVVSGDLLDQESADSQGQEGNEKGCRRGGERKLPEPFGAQIFRQKQNQHRAQQPQDESPHEHDQAIADDDLRIPCLRRQAGIIHDMCRFSDILEAFLDLLAYCRRAL